VVAVSEGGERDGGRAGFVATTTLAALYSSSVRIELADSETFATARLS